MKALTKEQRQAILARIDNYLMRIPIELSGCHISEGEYGFDLTIYTKYPKQAKVKA